MLLFNNQVEISNITTKVPKYFPDAGMMQVLYCFFSLCFGRVHAMPIPGEFTYQCSTASLVLHLKTV